MKDCYAYILPLDILCDILSWCGHTFARCALYVVTVSVNSSVVTLLKLLITILCRFVDNSCSWWESEGILQFGEALVLREIKWWTDAGNIFLLNFNVGRLCYSNGYDLINLIQIAFELSKISIYTICYWVQDLDKAFTKIRRKNNSKKPSQASA